MGRIEREDCGYAAPLGQRKRVATYPQQTQKQQQEPLDLKDKGAGSHLNSAIPVPVHFIILSEGQVTFSSRKNAELQSIKSALHTHATYRSRRRCEDLQSFGSGDFCT